MDEINNKNTEHKPVVWTPEDAANFITAAIREAQSPLTVALKSRGISRSIFALFVLLFLGSLAGSWVFFLHESSFLKAQNKELLTSYETLVNTPDLAAERRENEIALQLEASMSRERKALDQLAQLNVLAAGAEKLSADKTALEKANHDLQEQIDTLKAELENLKQKTTGENSEADTLRKNLEKANKVIEERTRRAELLSVQLEGKEDELAALKKQLTAAEALAKSSSH